MILNKRLLVLTTILIVLISSSEIKSQVSGPPYMRFMNHPWVDSVVKSMTIDEQIAQCIWVAAYSNRDISHEVEITDIIRKFGVGGLIFFQGTPEKQAELTNFYQKSSKVPLLIAMDAEWGLGMRLNNVEKFPYQMTLGAIKNDSLIYLMGKMVADQCKRLGVHVNLAPVSDINNNPMNPVINYRSFGENRENVASKSISYMRGMQDNGIIATAKHFPGHGDTNVDSHYDLPVLNHSRTRLDSLELYPFQRMIDENTGLIMSAHLNLPRIDTLSRVPSTLSSLIINGILREEMGFTGLVITDAMNMHGVTKYFKPGEAEAMAMIAGNDIIELVPDVDAAIKEIKRQIELKRISVEDVELKCRKIVSLKYWSGLSELKPVQKENISNDLSTSQSKALIRELYSKSITVLNNDQNILPLKNLQKLKIATLSINKSGISVFQDRISKYISTDNYFINPANALACNELLSRLSDYDLVIAGVFGTDQRPNMDFGIKPALRDLIDKLVTNHTTIITWFGNPYGIDRIESLQRAHGLILTYQENVYTEDLAAQLIFGGIGANGSLPVSIGNKWPEGFGIITPGNIRMQYGFPESAGMSSEMLHHKIDSISNIGLNMKAYPGCEVMVARKGIVVFQKSYGYQTYDSRIRLLDDDIFDLASVTKITATLPGLMLLETEGKFSAERNLGDYLPGFKRSDKNDLRLKDMLTHQAGLTAWIPFWEKTVKKNGQFKSRTFDYKFSDKFPLEVAEGLYINKNYRKKIFREIKKSPLGEKKYLYSDLTFIIAPDIIAKLSDQTWHEYVAEKIYRKIGANVMTFNPYLKYPLSRIVPTEYDSLFRKQLLHGTVHDEGAAMMGGISGHAGLFSTANDLMKLLELYRRMGEYGGEQLIAKEVMTNYTSVQFPENNNRRGLGFDKPLLNNSELSQKDSYPTRGASMLSFGHAGYTGTFVWIDPEYEISYIFLSNRVYPTRNNNIISALNIRTEILQAVYDSIEE